MDSFACSLEDKVKLMSDSIRNNRFEDRQDDLEPACGENVESMFGDLTAENDLLMEQILENINTTPIGQVLKRIASLPEVRKEKVLDVRRQLSKGRYKLNERLDAALDRVLEDLTA